MSTNIKTWQERVSDTTPAHMYPDAMRAEIAELRAALAKYEAQMLRMATCAGEFARDACKAQAPSAPVAPQDEREAFEVWARDPVRSEKLPLERWPGNDGYKDTRTYIAFYGWKSGRAALSVQAVPAAIPEGWISVHDRLPEEGAIVAALIYPYNNKENSRIFTHAEFYDGAFYNHEGDDLHPPTHWTPMPDINAAAPTPPQTGEA